MKNFLKYKILRKIRDHNQEELFRGSLISFGMKIAGLGCGQLFAFVVARFLGADAWGTFSLALSVITLGSLLATLGLDIGLLKLVAGNKKQANLASMYRKSFFLVLGASLLFTGLVYFYADTIAERFFHKPALTTYFEIAALAILPYGLIKLNSQTLRGLKEITKYVFISFLSQYLFALIMLILLVILFSGNHLVLVAFISGLYFIVFISFYWLYEEQMIGFKLNGTGSQVSLSRILKISLPLLLASSLLFVKGWIDTIMVGIFLTESDVGIYNITLKLSGVLSVVLTAVNTISAPKFAELYSEGEFDKLQEVVRYSTQMIFYASAPLLIVFVLFPEYILNIFGSEFTAGKNALILLSIGNFVNALSGSVGYFMQMTGSQVAFQNISLISTILGVILNYLLIPILGIEGAALSTCIGLVFWNLICVVFIQSKYKIRTYYYPFEK